MIDQIPTFFEKISLYILSALGGGAVLTASVIKWSSSIISDSIQRRIEKKYEMELEKYKHDLDDQTNRAKLLLNRISYISEKQYDKEFDIYLEVWDAIIKCRQCLQELFDAFTGPPAFKYEDQEKQLKEKAENFTICYSNLSATILKHAPFYEDQFYTAFVNISKVLERIFKVLLAASNSGYLQIGQKNTIASELSNIDKEIVRIQSDMRAYLHSLKVIQIY